MKYAVESRDIIKDLHVHCIPTLMLIIFYQLLGRNYATKLVFLLESCLRRRALYSQLISLSVYIVDDCLKIFIYFLRLRKKLRKESLFTHPIFIALEYRLFRMT